MLNRKIIQLRSTLKLRMHFDEIYFDQKIKRKADWEDLVLEPALSVPQSFHQTSLFVSVLELLSRGIFFPGIFSHGKFVHEKNACLYIFDSIYIYKTLWQFIHCLAVIYLHILTIFSQWLFDRMLSRNLMPP